MTVYRRKHSPAVFALALAMLAPVAAGCSSLTRGPTQIDSASGLYDKARLTYRADFPGMQAAATGMQLASYSPIAPADTGQADANHICHGTLEIVYPHPLQREGVALAKIVVGRETAPSKLSGWRRIIPWPQSRAVGEKETYSMDIQRSELDRIVGTLQQAGYFEKTLPSERASDLTARIDGGSVHRTWERVPELDALFAHVYATGRSALVADGPAWAASAASDQVTGVAPVARLPNAGAPLR